MPQSKDSTDENSSKIRNFLTKIFTKKDKRNALDNLGEYNYSLSQQLATSHKIISNLKDFSQKINDPILKERNTEADLIITNLIKPMLKEWLDNNLPKLVEKVIAEELKKLIPKK